MFTEIIGVFQTMDWQIVR